jgi:hydrogenase/urease accessory protein HupE
LAVALAVVLARPAAAHDPFEVTTDAHIAGERLDLQVLMSFRTAARICLGAPAPPDAFVAFRARFDACVLGFYRLSDGGQALPLRDARIELTGGDEVDMRLSYARPRRGPLRFDAPYLARLADPAAGILLTLTGERAVLGQALLRADAATVELPLEPAAPARWPLFRDFLRLGVRHILTGWDHLLFLAGLLLVCRRLRSAAAIITCFTAAHSITLALAALHLVVLPPRLVETVIAGTIMFVGVENVLRRGEPRARPALAFGFGLVHGLGFAGALEQAGLGANGSSIAVPLVAFNLGVEIGQLAVAAFLLSLFRALRSWPRFARRGTLVASLAVAAAGLYWLVVRAFG